MASRNQRLPRTATEAAEVTLGGPPPGKPSAGSDQLVANRRRSASLEIERPRRSAWEKIRVPFLRIVVGLALLGSWEFASGRLVLPALISSPTMVGSRLLEIIADGTAWYHLQVTAQEMAIGYAIGATLGVAFGTILGRSALIAAVLEPYILAFYSIPKIALAPLFIIWLGIGIESKIAIVVISSFFMTFVNTYAGMKNINEEYVHLLRIIGANRWQVMREVLFPSAAPNILLGLRTSVPYSVIGAVVAEMIASNRGLGYFILQSAGFFDTTSLFAGLVLLVAIVMGANASLSALERRILQWRPTSETPVTI